MAENYSEPCCVNLKYLDADSNLEQRIGTQRKLFIARIDLKNLFPLLKPSELQWHSFSSSFDNEISLKLVSKTNPNRTIGHLIGKGYGFLFYIHTFYMIGSLGHNITYEIIQKSAKNSKFDMYWKGDHIGWWEMSKRIIKSFDLQRTWLLFNQNGMNIATLKRTYAGFGSAMKLNFNEKEILFNYSELSLNDSEIDSALMNCNIWKQMLLFLSYIRSFRMMFNAGA